MKRLSLTICCTAVLFQSFCQVEGGKEPESGKKEEKADSPLIALVKNKDHLETIDLNSLNLSEYDDTQEPDLSRKTSTALLSECAVNFSPSNKALDEVSLYVDDAVFNIYGTHSITPVETTNIELGKQTFNQVVKLEIVEDYFLLYEKDTLARYENVYYSFFDKSQLLFEAFKKKRLLKGDLSQDFEGISFNIEDSNAVLAQSMPMTITPNPATNSTEVAYELWSDGDVLIKLSNAQNTIDQIILQDFQNSGVHTKQIPLDVYPAGVYVVSIFFQNQVYSTNLIKQ